MSFTSQCYEGGGGHSDPIVCTSLRLGAKENGGGWVLRGLTGTAGQRSSWHWNFTCKTRDTCVKLPHSYILNTQWSSEAFKSAIGQPLPHQMVTYILLLVGAALAHELNITFQNSIVSNLLPHSKQGCRSNQTEKRVRRDFKIGNQGDPGGIQ